MRTTLTLDPDVAARIQRIRDEQRRPLRNVVNDALRAGLAELEDARDEPARFETRPLVLGRCLVDDLDNVASVLAFAEGEAHG